MTGVLGALERGLERVLRLIAYAGGLVLAGLVALIIYEVFMRYFFGRPFRGGYEITELAMSLIVAAGLPYCAITRGHVAVDIFSSFLDRPGVRWLTAAIQFLGAALLALLSWEVFAKALSSVRFGDVSNMMQIPKAPFMFAISVSFGLFALVVLLEALRTASGTRSAVGHQPTTE